MLRAVSGALALIFVTTLILLGQPPTGEYQPKVHGPSKEGENAIPRIKVPAPLKVSLFAAEPMLANPVGFTFDNKGRCFVVETFRLGNGVFDNRGEK